MESTRRSRLVRTYVWAIITLAGASLVWAAFASGALPREPHDPVLGIIAFMVLGLLLQLAEHQLTIGPATGAIAFIVYLGSAVVFGGAWASVIAIVSLSVAQAIAKRRALRVAFNVAQHVLAVVVAATVYQSLGGSVPPRSLDTALLPFVAMVVAFFAINSTAVSAVVALSEGQRFDEVWLRNTWSWIGYDLIASALGLGIAWLYIRSGIPGMAVVVLPILFLRHTYFVNVQLQATNRELLELMVKAIEARDPYTSGHSQRVAGLARALANEMGIHLREVDNIATAALLHDVGKIYEEFAALLRKDGRLTPDERRIMESHPVRSAELVGTISNLRGYVSRCVRHHHENFDGSGYPDGIAGEQIPIGARIVLVADTADAMTTDRPYRTALSFERVLEELTKYAGRQFDPRVVAAFKRSPVVRRLVWEARPSSAPSHALGVERRVPLAVR
jgi:putative nucleotidyltransferase with HDIG domain